MRGRSNSGYEYRERLGLEAAGRSLIDWLVFRHSHSNAATWRSRLEGGELSLDGAPASAPDLLRAGQSLVWRRPPWEEPLVPLSFAILYRDAHLLAVAKPSGLPSQPNGGFLEHTLLHRVRRHHPEAALLHRLGRGTSGLVLFARTPEARRHLAAQFRAGEIEKQYRALVAGRPPHDAFTVEVPIGRLPHPRLSFVHGAEPVGRPAVSHVLVLERRADGSLVAVTIPTGRPHQIRIHMAAAGHPLVGDPLYAAGGGPATDAALPGEGGYWLHAHRLAFTHPLGGERVHLECPPPSLLRTDRERQPSGRG